MIIKKDEYSSKRIELDAYKLKWIALITMLIDHIGFVLIWNGKLYGYDVELLRNVLTLSQSRAWIDLYNVCRTIGRISFPIFAFLIAEGFEKTKDRKAYVVRMLIFAIISEIPFNLCKYNRILCFDGQNVLWTYVIGLLLLDFLEWKWVRRLPLLSEYAVSVVALIIACGLAFLLKTDYSIEGMLLIFIFYRLREDEKLMYILAIVVTALYSLKSFYGAAALSIIFIYLYNGEKGKHNFGWFCYIFYPLHLIILYAIVYFSYN